MNSPVQKQTEACADRDRDGERVGFSVVGHRSGGRASRGGEAKICQQVLTLGHREPDLHYPGETNGWVGRVECTPVHTRVLCLQLLHGDGDGPFPAVIPDRGSAFLAYVDTPCVSGICDHHKITCASLTCISAPGFSFRAVTLVMVQALHRETVQLQLVKLCRTTNLVSDPQCGARGDPSPGTNWAPGPGCGRQPKQGTLGRATGSRAPRGQRGLQGSFTPCSVSREDGERGDEGGG